MTYKEINKLKIDAYKNFIRMQYGQEALDRLNFAIKKEITDEIMSVRSRDFNDKIRDIDAEIDPD